MDVPLEVLVHIVAVDEPGDASDPQVSSWLGATAAAAVGHGAGIARRELQRGTRRWADGQVSAGRPLHLGFARRLSPPMQGQGRHGIAHGSLLIAAWRWSQSGCTRLQGDKAGVRAATRCEEWRCRVAIATQQAHETVASCACQKVAATDPPLCEGGQ